MAKQRKAPAHRPHLQKVRPVAKPVKCMWFATTPAYACERTGYSREYGVDLCNLHYLAAQQDVDDWNDRVRKVKDPR